jgi:hypothetical protein
MRLALFCLLVACSSPESGSSSTTTDSSTTSSGDSLVGDDSSTSDITTTTPKIPYCQQTCSTPSDCAAAAGGAFDGDNYTCESGLCHYKGCNNDAECTTSFMSAQYVCATSSGMKTCLKKCSAPTDCVVAGSKLYDADNWKCESSACKWIGCNADDECTSLGSNYVCRNIYMPGLDPLIDTTVKNCVKKCSAPADCATASAAFDADNYECDMGICKYIGCKTDDECKSSLMKSNYACR